VAQCDGDRPAGVDDADDGRAVGAPDGERDGFLDFLAEGVQDGAGQTHRVEPPEPGEAEFEGIGAEVVTADTKEEIARKKDPILFGLIEDRRRLYFVGDWEDEYCNLTLDKIADAVSGSIQTLPAKESP
jgi:hypothetical protein